MPEVTETQGILAALGMPTAQRDEIAALTFLALCGLKKDEPWRFAVRQSLTVKGIMTFIRGEYGKSYASNSRETFRRHRQVLHQFVRRKIADYNPDIRTLPTNNPKVHYAISEAALAVIRTFETKQWERAVSAFRETQSNLVMVYQPRGEHHQLEAQVIEQFAPQFATGAALLYLGATAEKDLFVAVDQLNALGISITEHDKLADIILHDSARNWVFLIELVTSHGPMTRRRVIELDAMFSRCSAGKVLVTAFPTFAEFRKHIKAIAWETHVWIAEAAEHLIHFNGDRFLGPR